MSPRVFRIDYERFVSKNHNVTNGRLIIKDKREMNVFHMSYIYFRVQSWRSRALEILIEILMAIFNKCLQDKNPPNERKNMRVTSSEFQIYEIVLKCKLDEHDATKRSTEWLQGKTVLLLQYIYFEKSGGKKNNEGMIDTLGLCRISEC